MKEKQTQLNILPEYEDMLEAGMHYGRKKTVFNPNMRPYIYTSRENIYIIDLVKTNSALFDAIEFLKKSLEEGGVVLFVGPTKQSADLVKETAEHLKMPYVVERWIGGTLTNFKTIRDRVKQMLDLGDSLSSPEKMKKHTKKEKIKMERELRLMKDKFGGIQNMTKMPDVIFVSSLKESQLPIREAKRLGIKTVGIVNTDSDPKMLDYPIPANDNSRGSVKLVLDTIKKSLK
ncbi:MAG: 30S ribosomal protein S2 [Candidatus Yanofskybacteria bacterium CG10_big_fil_rev_8_21_14_0_10_36_16]|uniref:Small ribosomal subunit protein uS2 n=1 Tax=Candidatus Yanofskybacteria bacterium CG10_big_fil_rev_8_21_14_0_10_36_16 TaxID=1975096 RepID=A0A2J0QB67_9BACT|nr:MAG: 30S ribosomal protein S2 [Candidatus Yanofskybacteria bacterium CG10_big_fil_rev_8_21_14_0_10_36_16]